MGDVGQYLRARGNAILGTFRGFAGCLYRGEASTLLSQGFYLSDHHHPDVSIFTFPYTTIQFPQEQFRAPFPDIGLVPKERVPSSGDAHLAAISIWQPSQLTTNEQCWAKRQLIKFRHETAALGVTPSERSLAFREAAQQSVHLTCGILWHFQAFFWLRLFSAHRHFPSPPTSR